MTRFLQYLAGLILCCNVVWADTVYKCRNAKGVLEYQQFKCSDAKQLLSSWETRVYQSPVVNSTDKSSPYSLVLTQGMAGHYSLEAEVDSIQTNFLVDTGATRVSLTEATAKAARLVCSGMTQVITATQVVMACETTKGKLTFGKFILRNVPALV